MAQFLGLFDHTDGDFWAELLTKFSEKIKHIDGYTKGALILFYLHEKKPYRELIPYLQSGSHALLVEGDKTHRFICAWGAFLIAHSIEKSITDMRTVSQEFLKIDEMNKL
jgi:hypothetical protein